MLWLTVHETVINNRLNFQGRLIRIFTCVSYAEARNSYRLDVRPSVRPSHAGIVSKWLNILSCFLRHTIAILVLCVSKIFAKFRRGHPLWGRQTEVGYWGMIKPAIFQKHGASINRSIQRAINLVRRSTAINTLATAVCIYR